MTPLPVGQVVIFSETPDLIERGIVRGHSRSGNVVQYRIWGCASEKFVRLPANHVRPVAWPGSGPRLVLFDETEGAAS